jgi:hypothetical protein
VTQVTQILPSNKYSCEICNKEYLSRNGLWKHKKLCSEKKPDDDISTKQLVLLMLQQNNKVQDALY